jgi:hypothetical protein
MTIEIGTAIVSYIEPAPGQARAFNEWYERDHFPATVLAGPGVFAGARFVATRVCKDLRPADATLFGDPRRGSYLAVAWVLPGKQAEWDAWVAREMEQVAAQGRLFAGREHVHTAVYRFAWEQGDVPAIVALDRGVPGVIAIATTTASASAIPPDRTCVTFRFMGPISHASSIVGLELERTIVSSAEPPPHTLVLAFCQSDPIATFAAVTIGDAGFASPFLATIPGTDAYAEDL